MQSQEQTIDYVSRDFINPPIMISKNKKMIDVIEKLTEMGISRLIVHDSGKPIGIITTKDWAHIFLKTRNTINHYDIELTEIMHNIIYVDSMTTIKDCAKIFLAKGVSSLAIKHEGGHIDGIFTKTDMMRFFSTNYSDDSKVSEYMTKDVVFTHQEEPLYKVIRKMLNHRIPRIVVTTDDNSLKIITMGDFFRAAFGIDHLSNVEERALKLEKMRENVNNKLLIGNKTLAKDIMSRKSFITVNSSDSLKSACKIMLSEYVDAVGVIDNNQKLCGILSKTDIICAILSQTKKGHTVKQIELKKSAKTKTTLKLLVVDDSIFSLNVYKDVFEKRGHEVDLAIDGSACLDRYNFEMIKNSFISNKPPYDMVILDYEMPGLKVDVIAQRILNINPNQKIIIISSWEIEKMQKEFSSLADYVKIVEKGTPLEAIISKFERCYGSQRPKLSN